MSRFRFRSLCSPPKPSAKLAGSRPGRRTRIRISSSRSATGHGGLKHIGKTIRIGSYDDFKDQPWSELFDANDEENRETVRIIGDILILLTSKFEFAGKKDGCLKTLVGALFRLLFFWRYFSWKWSPPRPPYPFLSKSDRDAAREQFLLHRAEYVPKFIPQSVYDIYIASESRSFRNLPN